MVKRRTNFGQKNHQFWSKERPQLVSKKLELTTGILSEAQKRTTRLPSHLLTVYVVQMKNRTRDVVLKAVSTHLGSA